MEDQKSGEDQLEHCSGSPAGITQHNSDVSVERNRHISEVDVSIWVLLQAEVGLTRQGTEGSH